MRHACSRFAAALLAPGILSVAILLVDAADAAAPDRQPAKSALRRLKYNNPGLVVDLGAGLLAWPIPMDFDGDGDLDLVLSCSDVPYNGAFFHENPGGDEKYPVFKPARRIGRGQSDIMPSYVSGRVRILLPGREVDDIVKTGLEKTTKLSAPDIQQRAIQWRYADYDGDGLIDLVVGVSDRSEYGWEDAFDAQGRWTRGPLHGYVYLLRNRGDADKPVYAQPVKIEAGGRPIDVYGRPSPNLADFDGDGDLDLVCGEFFDRLTYFQNVGTRTEPKYAAGRFLQHQGKTLRMDLCMIVPVAVDWDRDGDVDLVVGQEDGRVAFVDNTGGQAGGVPVFLPPRFFQQEADAVKFGGLATPFAIDWDGDGDEDLLCGNTAGYIGLIENLGSGPEGPEKGVGTPRFAAPKYLAADGQTIRIMAGSNGSIQGPCEAKWGYTTPSAADWDGDRLPDLLVNSIWGKVVWYKNIGTRQSPKLAAALPVEVEWPGKPPKPAWNWWDPQGRELVTQWRTTPFAVDFDGDGLCDLVMLDHEGYLALFQRAKQGEKLVLLPPKRIFMDENGKPLRLADGYAGAAGRRKFCLTDWDRDGRVDLLINGRNIDFLRNVKEAGGVVTFRNMGPLDSRRLAGHSTSPTVVDWNNDGVPELVVGAEDGHFYYLKQ